MKHNLDICIIAAEQDLPRLEKTLKTIPKYDNIYILENKRSESGEELLELVHSTGTIHHWRWHWVDKAFHFGNARNKSFELSQNEWIFWLDCDDSISNVDCQWIDDNLNKLDETCGAIMFNCTGLSHFEDVSIDQLDDVPGLSMSNWGYWSTASIRLLRRKWANWEGRVHEQVLESVIEAGGNLMISDMVIRHRGYVLTVDKYMDKLKRNIELLKLQLDESENYEAIYMGYLESSTASLKGLQGVKDRLQNGETSSA
jgi:hypothetical protein